MSTAAARALLAAGGLLAAAVQATVVYRCESADGRLHFGDSRVPGARCTVIPGTEQPVPASPPAATPGTATPATPAAPAQAPGSPQPGPDPAAYAFLRLQANALQAEGRAAQETLAALTALTALAAQARPAAASGFTAARRLTVLHFGDSHVHSGHVVQALREHLQQALGTAGRGMVFPASIARTYAQNDLQSSFEGRWTSASSVQQPPRLPLGVSGFVAHNADPRASFTLRFSRPLPPGTDTVKVFFGVSSPWHRLIVSSGEHQQSTNLDFAPGAAPPFVALRLPAMTSTVRVDLLNVSSQPAVFELHGVSLEAEAARGGVLVHNLGVGGSGFAALEQQQHFEPQFAALEPDIVLLDWGTNDIIDRERVGPGHADLVARTVRRIRAVRPQAVIVLTSVQDMLPRGRRAPPAAAYAGLMRELAARHGCLFYDWHDVAGGDGAMAHWRQAQLAQPDGVHLSAAGYRLKGRLLAEALLRAMGASREPPARPAGSVPARS